MRLFPLALLLTLICANLQVAPVFGQATIYGITPVKVRYQNGDSVKIYGKDIYSCSVFPTVSCDSMVWQNTTTGGIYGYRHATVPNCSGQAYQGVNGAPDSVYFRIPLGWPCGLYTVKFYEENICGSSTPNISNTITVLIQDSAGISYPGGAHYCIGESNPTPTIVGDPGSFFVDSAATGAYSILTDSLSGTIALHFGSLGTHKIRFTTGLPMAGCADTTYQYIRVDTMRSSAIGYSAPSFCKNLGSVSPSMAPVPSGGTYSAVPASLVISPSTGAVDLLSSPPGNYSVNYTPHVDSCALSSSTSLRVIDIDSAIFDYLPSYCKDDTDAVPTITRLPANGFFRERPPGTGQLVINPASGAINLGSSLAGTYYVEVASASTCFVTKSDTVTIRPRVDARFTAPTQICKTVPQFAITLIDSGGTFFCPSGNIVFQNASLGIINVQASSVGGPFMIYYSMPDPQCPDTVQAHIRILAKDTAVLSYASDSYCKNQPHPLPQFISGNSGGSFSMPGGVIKPQTGKIDLDSTIAGTYIVFYTMPLGPCQYTIPIDTITVRDVPLSFFNMVATNICKNSGTYPIDTITVSAGSSSIFTLRTISNSVIPGAFSGSTLNSANTIPGGPFKIVRQVSDAFCSDSFVDYLSVWRVEDPRFAYIPDRYCRADQDPLPLIFGDGGGVFRALAPGLSIVDSTGRIMLSISNQGIHEIEYTTPGPCPQKDTFTISIVDQASPTFEYAIYEYCETDTSIIFPTVVPQGVQFHFETFPAGLWLDTITGAFDLSQSQPGIYNVVLTLDNVGGGACQTSASQSITITLKDSITVLSFADSTFCRATDSFATAIVTPAQRGAFFASPGLIWANRDSGVVAIYATPPGRYDIRFRLQTVCAEQVRDTIVVESPSDADFYYAENQYCRTDSNPTPTIATPGGSFTWTAISPVNAILTFANSTTGEIDLRGCTPGTFDIHYNNGTGCPGDTTKRITIYPGPTNIGMTVTPNDTICKGETVEFTAFGGFYYKIYKNGRLLNNSSFYRTDTLKNGDVILAEMEDLQGCKNTVDTTITVFPIPNGFLVGEAPTFSGEDPVEFTMGTDANTTTLHWTLAGQGSITFPIVADSVGPIDSAQTAVISASVVLRDSVSPAIAIFRIIPIAKGCIGSADSVFVKINPDQTAIFIPEVFTPNGDFKNDTWQIQWRRDINPDDYVMLVYNRSGGLVYEMNGLNDLWDGGTMPDGVYWYHLRTKSNQTVAKGAVTIRRR